MNIDKSTKYGSINISPEAIISVAIDATLQCYGVVGMANKKNFVDEIDGLLKKANFSKGVIARKTKTNTFEIDLFIIVAYGVRVTEVAAEVQKKVRYDLEQKFNIKFKAINVYVQRIKNI